MPSSLDDFTVLISARVVCRECLSLHELPHVVERIDGFLQVGSMVKACILGSVRLMSYVAARSAEANWENVVYHAVRNGHVHILQWLSDFHADRCYWCRALHNAVVNGQLAVVKWLHINGTEGCSTYAMDMAAEGGHLDVVKWLHENRTEGCTTNAMTYAASHGHLDVVQWLHENRSEGCSEEANRYAAGNGHLDVVQWLDANGYKGNFRDTVETATRNGHLRITKWLLRSIDNEKEHESYTGFGLEVAKKGYYMGVIQWLETQVKADLATNKRQRLAY
ncbi:hypothetical protein V7S43_012537 [Phytophthora oleae]|uniref:Ankyrin repeat-containing domain n=1 Tax=Phytophthora oleae TaxID=2107226 RepID=A0ABD3F769_9STRA